MSLKLRNGIWHVDIRMLDYPEVRKSTGYREPDRALAEAEEERIRGDILAGRYDPDVPAELTVQQAFELGWKRHWQYMKGADALRPTLDDIVRTLGPDKLLSKVDEQVLVKFKDAERERGNTAATINRKLSAISKLMKMACYDWKKISSIPRIAREVERPRPKRAFTREEEEQALAVLRASTLPHRQDVADLIVVLADQGLRLSETLRLENPRDIDFALGPLGMIHVWEAKGGEAASVPILTQRVRRVLWARRDMKRPFGMLNKNRVLDIWKQVRTQLGWPASEGFGVHGWRHTTATRLIERKVHLRKVQKILRHSSIVVTEGYSHVDPEQLSDVVGVLEDVGNKTQQGEGR